MPKLPRVKPRVVIKALQKAGFRIDHVSGSHYVLYKDDHLPPVTVPYHNNDMRLGTLSAVLKSAKISREAFRKLL